MRTRGKCGRCRRIFVLTTHKTRCQRCVLSNKAILDKRFNQIISHKQMRGFVEYMDKWYGATA